MAEVVGSETGTDVECELQLEDSGLKATEWASPVQGNAKVQYVDNICLETTPNEKDDGREVLVATPAVGMTYDSWEAIDIHFRCYAKQTGFAVTRVGAGCRQKGGKMTKVYWNVTWRCEQWGEHNLKPPNTRSAAAKLLAALSDDNGTDHTVKGRESSVGYSGVVVAETKSKKCNCPVTLYAAGTKDGLWTIKKAVLQHENHEPSPSKNHFISSYRQLAFNPSIRRRLINDFEAGVKISQIHKCLARERDGVENFPLTQRDLRNAVGKVQREKLAGGDANAMYAYLRHMSEDNDQFFYEYRLDEFKRLKDVMWVDARSRAAYEDFGDVVCFDSTYITNKYELPFANFVGVNHHGQSLLLGCALVYHEDSETFDWVFSNWLRCMGGKPPGGFLTDQDDAMRKSILNTMPGTKHRWCLWHILQKFSKKLGAYERYEELKEELHNSIYDSMTPKEFESSWNAAIKAYGLKENVWLKDLFDQRGMWVPTYMKHLFWAGMKTTQRSESINHFFDGFVHRNTRLYQFVQQYVNAIEHRANDAKNADADCVRYTQRCVTTFPLERIFRKVYTHNKFCDVQLECSKVLYVRPVKTEEVDDNTLDITLVDRVWILHKPSHKEIATEGRRTYKVRFNNDTREARCVCKMFESHGILCRHIIVVCDTYQVREVPEKYILKRWRKDVKWKHTKVKVASYDPSKTEEVKRMDKMNVCFETLCLEASYTDEDAELVLEMIRNTGVLIKERHEKAGLSFSGDTTSSDSLPLSGSQNSNLPGICGSDRVAVMLPNGISTPGEKESAIRPEQEIMPNIGDPPTKKKVGRNKEKRYLSCVEKAAPKSCKKNKEQLPLAPGCANDQGGYSRDHNRPIGYLPHMHSQPYGASQIDPYGPPPYGQQPYDYNRPPHYQYNGPPSYMQPHYDYSRPQGQVFDHGDFGYTRQDPPDHPPSSDMVYCPGIGYVRRLPPGRFGPIPDWFYRDCIPNLSSEQQ